MKYFLLIWCIISLQTNAQINVNANNLLLSAALHGNVQDIKSAINFGANVNLKNEQGATALSMVYKLSYEFLFPFLIRAGADVNESNHDKISPLHWAVEYDNVSMVKELLKNGANVHAVDGIHETPLHWAAWTDNIQSAKLLLGYGANPNAKNNTGVTPIDLSIRQEHTSLQTLLNEFKAIDDQIEVTHIGIEKYIRSFMDTSIFQGTVLVAKGDSVIHRSAYGFFDVENKIPNRINSQFLIGSLTKSFVAVAILQLVENGLIDLQSPVEKYIPLLKPELGDGLTIHHLLKQQSGLSPSLDGLTDFEIMDITPVELLQIINTSKRSFKPGSNHQYSNINYSLLAMVIESVTGKKYPDYLNEKTFIPTGMVQSGMERLLNIPSNRAIGYRNVNGIFRRVQNVVSYAFGSGDMYASITDIYKWSKALLGNKLLSNKYTELLFDGGNQDWGYYGYGFRIQPYLQSKKDELQGKMIRHGGTMNGFISNYNYYKEDDLTVIVLSNNRDTPIRKLCFKIKETVLGMVDENRQNVFKE